MGADEPGRSDRNIHHDVLHLSPLRRCCSPPLPLLHPRPQHLLSGKRSKLGFHQSGSDLPPGSQVSSPPRPSQVPHQVLRAKLRVMLTAKLRVMLMAKLRVMLMAKLRVMLLRGARMKGRQMTPRQQLPNQPRKPRKPKKVPSQAKKAKKANKAKKTFQSVIS